MRHRAAAPRGSSCRRHGHAVAQGGRLTSSPVTEFAARRGKVPTLAAARRRALASSGLAAPWQGPPRWHGQLREGGVPPSTPGSCGCKATPISSVRGEPGSAVYSCALSRAAGDNHGKHPKHRIVLP